MTSGDLKRSVLLDSVILIDHFNGIEAATNFLLEVGDRGFISAITRAEVLTGFEAADEPIAAKLLDQFRHLSIDAPIADLAASLRREYRWKLPDAFQAAAARHHDMLLATRNTRDFPPERFDFVTIPYRLS